MHAYCCTGSHSSSTFNHSAGLESSCDMRSFKKPEKSQQYYVHSLFTRDLYVVQGRCRLCSYNIKLRTTECRNMHISLFSQLTHKSVLLTFYERVPLTLGDWLGLVSSEVNECSNKGRLLSQIQVKATYKTN